MNFDILIMYLLSVPAIFIAITIHEFTKGAVSTALGDMAPKNDRRLTLNPFNHFEPIGFIFLMFFGFGWGKPVRTSGVYYKNRRMDTVITYTAPILANIVFSFIFALLNAVIVISIGNNRDLMIVRTYAQTFCFYLIQYNLSLALFNFIPVAPLCGNRIMTALMSPNNALKATHYEKILQIILVMLLLFDNIIGKILSPLIEVIIRFYDYIINIIFF